MHHQTLSGQSPFWLVASTCLGRSLAPLLLALAASITSAAPPEPLVLSTEHATFTIATNGSLVAIARKHDRRDYLAPGQPSPLLSLRISGTLHSPERAAWDATARQLTLHYTAPGMRYTAVLRAEAKPTHVVFELLNTQPSDGLELVLWGPYPTTIGDTIGEVVGVVRDPEFAVGIQTLNPKTLGGYPTHENDIEADYSADDPGRYPDLPAELNKDQLFRGDTARPTRFGSVLQAFCRNRDRQRIIANWGHEKYVAPPYADGGVIGSRIALFACPASQALETIGAIELAEGLPHPILDGTWVKMATNANCSYLIVDFSEQTIDRAIEMTRRAGLNYLYHGSPFETWGHFKLKPSLFPNGWDGLQTCVEKARRAGVRIGFHTLSNFLTPNDPYVTPKPDPRLARIGATTLTGDIDAAQTVIPIASPDYFKKQTDMNTLVLGDELVRYASVSSNAPWRLLDCQRGAWGTIPAPHPKGAPAAKLMDHGYKVFLTDASLTREVAENIARLCNHAGTLQISLDGLEGAWSTGMGQYGRALLTHSWYNALAPELRGQINDASNPGHFNWHVYTRMNWGEPWYAGFRESQTLYRFKNQLHFDRNLMPRMLGWFALRPDTSLEDAEWLLARAAGFRAGFALATSLASTAQLEADPNSADAARQFGAIPAILAAIKEWEAARLAGAFPAEAMARLRDNTREFHLEPAGPGKWDLFEFHLERHTHDAATPTASDLKFSNPYAPQPLQWTVRSTSKQPIAALAVEVNGKPIANLQSASLPPGGCLKYTAGPAAVLYDATWKEIGRVSVDAEAGRADHGPGRAAIGCAPQDAAGAPLKIEIRTQSPPTRIGRGTEIIQDNRFRRGLILWDPQPGRHLKYGEAAGFETNSKPVWGLAQWSSRHPLDPATTPSLPRAGILLGNTAKSVALGRNGADLSLGVNSAVEYGPQARQLNQPWVHLLVEQEFENPPFLETLSAATFHLEARLLNSTNLHRGDYDPGRHAAQFQVFLTVQNRNRQSPGFGDMLWFGIPIFDSRHRHPPEFKSKDFGGTEKFIFTPAAATYTPSSAHDGAWVVIDHDLLPLMRDALDLAWKNGFLTGSKNLADYAIGGMNMGWELPGTFQVEIQTRNLSLRAIR